MKLCVKLNLDLEKVIFDCDKVHLGRMEEKDKWPRSVRKDGVGNCLILHITCPKRVHK